MFGIKTKKDKEIERLKKELNDIKNFMIQPRIIYENPKIADLVSKFEIYFEDLNRIDEDYVNRVLANELMYEVKKHMDVTSEDDYMRRKKIFMARIRVVEK